MHTCYVHLGDISKDYDAAVAVPDRALGRGSQIRGSLWGAPKSPNNITSTFFNTVHLLAKDLSFDHGGAKLASCPGRHLTSLRPCAGGITLCKFLKATTILASF